MADELIYVKNELNDVIGTVPRSYLGHPILGVGLVEVPDGRFRGRLSEITGTADKDVTVDATPADVAKIASKAETKDK